MRFGADIYLWALVFAPVALALYGRAFRRKREALARLVAPVVAGWGGGGATPGRQWLKALALAAALAFLALGLAQPQWGKRTEDVPRRGRDLVFLLDVSLSMLAEDASPNRLARAKAAIKALVGEIRRDGGHRLGLIAFAGRAGLQCPLTFDYAFFEQRLAEAGPDSAPRKGTLIGGALRRALEDFAGLDPHFTDIILLSDGEDHDSFAREAASAAAARGVSLYAVGIGDPEAGAPVPVRDARGRRAYLEFAGEQVRSRMDSDLLRRIARLGKGAFLAAGTGPIDLIALYRHRIAPKARRLIEATGSERPVQRYQWFVLAALLLLATEMLLRDRPPSGQPGAGTRLARPTVLIGLALALLLPAFTWGESAYRRLAEGNALYGEGRYRAALAQYEVAAKELAAAPELQFNIGDAYFKRHRLDRAAERYKRALSSESTALQAKAAYNLGNVRYQQALNAMRTFKDAARHIQVAIRYYRESLDIDGGQPEVRYNLELARRLLKELRNQNVILQRNPKARDQRSSPSQGQPFDLDQQRAAGGEREASPDANAAPQDEAGRKAPEGHPSATNRAQMRQAARPKEMSAEEAEKLVESLRARAQAAEGQRRQWRRARMRETGEAKTW